MCIPKYPAWTFLLSGLIGLLLSGCTSNVGDDINISMGELALHDAVPKAESIAKLEMHISAAKNENMPFLAPNHFREGSNMFKAIQRKSTRNVSTYDLAKADVILDKGEAVIEKVKSQLGKELELKRLLDKLSAEDIYPWRYKMNMYELSRLIERIELGRAGNIERDKADLNESLQKLYDKTVEYNSLHGSGSTAKEAK